MDLEWHQLEMPYASLRAHSRERQRRLRLCLEASGQQQPIVVVPERESPGRYVVIDGHQRITALRRLGHDTVEALVWEMEEAEALVLRWQMAHGPGSSALEQGWLLAELQHRFGWSQDELAQRFFKSSSWVSRLLGMVRELPLSIQESIRRGQIPAQAAMKALVPLARIDRQACQWLAEQIARHKLTAREIGALYSGWLAAGGEGRRRLLEDPRAFLRLQQRLEERKTALDGPERLLGRAERLASQARHLSRQISRYQSEFSNLQLAELHQTLEEVRSEWDDLLDGLKPAASSTTTETRKETMHAEQRAEDRHPGAPQAGARDTGDQEVIEHLARSDQEGDRLAKPRATADRASDEGRAPSRRDSRASQDLQGQSDAGPRGASDPGSEALLSGPDGLLPQRGHRRDAEPPGRPLPLRTGAGDAARHLPTPGEDRWQGEEDPDRGSRFVPFQDDLHPVLPEVSPIRVQELSDRGSEVLRRSLQGGDDRQHPRGSAAGQRQDDDPGAGDGGLQSSLRLPLPGSRDRRRQPIGPRGEELLARGEELLGGQDLRGLPRSEPAGPSVVQDEELELQTPPQSQTDRAVCLGEDAAETSAGPHSPALQDPPSHRQRRGLRLHRHPPVLGAAGLDRPTDPGPRDAGDHRDRDQPIEAHGIPSAGDRSSSRQDDPARASDPPWPRPQEEAIRPGGEAPTRDRS